MKDNALRIILFLYILSGCMAAVDVLVAAPLGIQLQTLDGQPAGPQISTILERMEHHNMATRMAEAAGALDAASSLERAILSIQLSLEMSVEMFKMLTGLYAFDVLTIFGVPAEITAVISSAYVLLAARALMGYMVPVAAGIQALSSAGRTVGGAIAGALRA